MNGHHKAIISLKQMIGSKQYTFFIYKLGKGHGHYKAIISLKQMIKVGDKLY